LLAVQEGLGLGRRDVRVGVEVVDDRRLDILVRFLALVALRRSFLLASSHTHTHSVHHRRALAVAACLKEAL
jgi:hypothetical protein